MSRNRGLHAVEDAFSERARAEDILLGSLGYGEEATLLSIVRTEHGYTGTGQWRGGETFDFVSEGQLDPLEEWALGVLGATGK